MNPFSNKPKPENEIYCCCAGTCTILILDDDPDYDETYMTMRTRIKREPGYFKGLFLSLINRPWYAEEILLDFEEMKKVRDWAVRGADSMEKRQNEENNS